MHAAPPAAESGENHCETNRFSVANKRLVAKFGDHYKKKIVPILPTLPKLPLYFQRLHEDVESIRRRRY